MHNQMNGQQGKNAIQHVHDVQSQLQSAKSCLNQAISTVEKPENKKRIQDTLNAVDNALNTCNTTITNYQES
ncbi:hypothetical protein SH1V18_40780 [Vallitalea longa]|uniref:Uncharacterized protein n=1 Tax=Vallitalea longa TaxID=2936439 RepID=A0A9W5YFZ0_9FIRM|nr:hypothetical protein [Vallitalea longa]GKX31598.1 hypothetical protein SH1V18_40780 [Vallitalea longa]